jgi:hypothetical protein
MSGSGGHYFASGCPICQCGVFGCLPLAADGVRFAMVGREGAWGYRVCEMTRSGETD